jgi:starch synthase
LSPVRCELLASGTARTRLERTVHDGRLPSGVEVSLLGGDAPADTTDLNERALRGAWFAHAVAAAARQRFAATAARPGEGELEAVIAVGEGAGMVSLALREAGRGTSLAPVEGDADGPSYKLVAGLSRISVPLSPADDWTFDRASLARAGFADALFTPEGVEFYGRVSFAKAAAIAADRIVALGEAPLEALTSPGAAHRLEGVYRARGRELLSIGGGVDPSHFNSAIDPHLPQRFDPEDLSGKARCKSTYVAEQELDHSTSPALMVAVGGAASGLDEAMVEALDRALRGELVVSVAIARAVTESALDQALVRLERLHPGRARVRFGASEASMHRALGAADYALVLDPETSCGSAARAPMRYGAVPIAAATPPMREAIVDMDASFASGTGVLFEAANDGVFGAIQRALSTWGTPALKKAQRRVMRVEGGWERAARRLEALLQQLEG